MGRCLSPCLGDLDPNLYRRRLDEVLALFAAPGEHQPLLARVDAQMRHAAAAQRYEQAASLRRRHRRLRTILDRLGGVLEATHARPRLILAAHPAGDGRTEAFWLAGGRLVDHGPLEPRDSAAPAALAQRCERALARAGRAGDLGAHVPPHEVDEVRIVSTWLASHPDTPQLSLRPAPGPDEVAAFVGSGREGELDHDRLDVVRAHAHV
jgi:DNA polymerase-3 subunit epsilon